MLETLYDSVLIPLSQWIEQHQAAMLGAVFFISFAESIILLSILVPSTVLLAGIGASFAATDGKIELMWLAASAGAVAGDSTSLAMGRCFRNDISRIWPFSRYPDLVKRSETVFRQWGWFALIVSKFAYGVRPFIPLTAGMLSMPLASFLLLSAISSVLWAAVALGVGFGAVHIINY